MLDISTLNTIGLSAGIVFWLTMMAIKGPESYTESQQNIVVVFLGVCIGLMTLTHILIAVGQNAPQ